MSSLETLESRHLLTAIGPLLAFHLPVEVAAEDWRNNQSKSIWDVALADVDGDARDDLVILSQDTTDTESRRLEVLRRSDGNWESQVEISTAQTDLAFADFDQDGSVEIWGLDNHGKPIAFDWMNSEEISPLHQIEMKGQPGALDYADFDNNGHLDALSFVDSQVQVLYRDETGTAPLIVGTQSQAAVVEPTVVDIDNDGDLDLLCVQCKSLLGEPPTSEEQPTVDGSETKPPDDANPDPQDDSPSDEADARADDSNTDRDQAAGAGDSTTNDETESNDVASDGVQSEDQAANDDEPHDIIPDIADLPSLVVFVNQGMGQFEATRIAIDIEVSSITAVEVDDFDSDGRPDLIISLDHLEASAAKVYLQKAQPVDEQPRLDFELALEFDAGDQIETIVTTDIDQDQVQDLIIQTLPKPDGPPRISILLGCDGCELGFQQVTMPHLTAGRLIGAVDDRLLFQSSQDSRLVEVRLDPNAVGKDLHAFPTQLDPSLAQFTDVNSDSVPDVVGLQGGELHALLSDGEGGYVAEKLLVSDLQNASLLVDEFDFEPGPDALLVGSTDEETIFMRPVYQEGALQLAEVLRTDRGVIIATRDLDNDGLPDFVFRNDFVSSNRSSSILLNRGDHWLPRTLSQESGTVAIENLDGDNTLEAYVFEDPIRIFKYQNDEFLPWGEIPKGTTRAHVLDLNGDQLKDFVSVHKRGGLNIILTPMIARGDGIWDQWDSVNVSSSEFVDVNGDGLVDIVSPRHFYLSDGDGGWTESSELPSDSPIWGEENEYVDINGDGLVDNVKYHIADGRLEFHILSSDLSWTSSEAISANGDYDLLDLNGDQFKDLIQLVDNELIWTPSTAAGWFAPQLLASSVDEYIAFSDSESLVISVLSGSEVVEFTFSVALPSDEKKDEAQSSEASSEEDESGTDTEQDETGTTSMKSSKRFFVGDIELADINDDGYLDLISQAETPPLEAQLTRTVWLGSALGFEGPVEFHLPQPPTRWYDTALWVSQPGNEPATSHSTDSLTLPHLSFFIPTPLAEGDVSDEYGRVVADVDLDGDEDILAITERGLLVFLAQSPGDLDRNGRIEVHDVDLLRSVIQKPEYRPRFDLDLNGVLNEADVQFWLEVANVKLGDADLDGEVDFTDFLRLSLNFGKETWRWSDADFDGDGRTSFTDFLILSRFFGSPRLQTP